MPESIEQVNVMLEGRMPHLRQEVEQLSEAPRKFKAKDGQIYQFTYILDSEASVATTNAPDLSLGNVFVVNAGTPAKAENFLGRILDGDEFVDAHMLAFTKAKVFNQPRLQNLVQSMGATTRFGMVVEDEPEKITLSKVEAVLKEWLPVWSRELNSEVKDHSPYLAIRHRLSDETTGRLDASKIAKLFNLSMAEMGTLCAVSKQSIHANPTSKGIQEKLEPLVKAARGVLWCGGDESKFKTWLNQPNPDFPEYEGRQLTPLDLIRMGHAQVIADKVQNLLTGHPA
ncbi:MAG: hypothetical protein B7Z37_26505 [Verrucomicrobia bacterium 12-59-8]|nr:MAG: hypothetical protein B7Z37_26505 [Verrucomicrobia bacterium 12-59-8]